MWENIKGCMNTTKHSKTIVTEDCLCSSIFGYSFWGETMIHEFLIAVYVTEDTGGY